MTVRFRDQGPFVGAVFVGDHLFAGYGSSLLSFDTGAETLSYLASTQPLPGVVTDVVVADQYAFVTTADFRGSDRRDAGLFVIDVSDPSDLRLVATVPFVLGANTAVLNGTTLYVASAGFFGGSSSQYAVVDVTDPASPRVIGTVAGAALGRQGLAYRDGFVYGSTGAVIDVRDPEHPVRAARLRALYFAGLDIVLHGDRAYVSRIGQISVFDIADPLAPAELEPISLPDQVDVWGALAIVGDTLWAAGDSRSLEDATDPARGVVVRFDLTGIEPPALTDVPLLAIGMNIREDRIALAGIAGSGEADGYAQLMLNPFRLGVGQTVGGLTLATLKSDGVVAASDSYRGLPMGAWGAAAVGSATVVVDDKNLAVHAREPDDRLHMLGNLHFAEPDPFEPAWNAKVGMGIVEVGGRVWTVQEAGLVGYVLTSDYELVEPVLIPQQSDLFGDRLAAALGRLVVLHSDSSTNSDVLQVFDVTTTPPRLIDRLPLETGPYYGRGLVAAGNRLFAMSDGHVRVVTMDSDGLLSRGARRSLSGIPGQAAIAGPWLFVPVTSESQGEQCTVEVFDARSPNLERVRTVLLPEGNPIGVAVATVGTSGFVLTGDSRLHHFRLQPPFAIAASISVGDGPACEAAEDCFFVESRGSVPWLTVLPTGGLYANLVYDGAVVVEWTPSRAAFSVLMPLVRGR